MKSLYIPYNLNNRTCTITFIYKYTLSDGFFETKMAEQSQIENLMIIQFIKYRPTSIITHTQSLNHTNRTSTLEPLIKNFSINESVINQSQCLQ